MGQLQDLIYIDQQMSVEVKSDLIARILVQWNLGKRSNLFKW